MCVPLPCPGPRSWIRQTIRPGSLVFDNYKAGTTLRCHYNMLNVLLCDQLVHNLEVMWDMHMILKSLDAPQQGGTLVVTNTSTELDLSMSAAMQQLSALCEDQGQEFLMAVISGVRRLAVPRI